MLDCVQPVHMYLSLQFVVLSTLCGWLQVTAELSSNLRQMCAELELVHQATRFGLVDLHQALTVKVHADE